tara:strand:- start:1111 stop:1266 length:156 start_codon:yes stop_codon:yes gene_type:complete
MTKLNKGAIPRLTQEIFYKCHPNGSVKLNRELTLKEFDNKLKELIKNRESK